MDAVFITNTRGLDSSSNQDDRKLVYRDFPNWNKPTFEPPIVYSWQDAKLSFAGFDVCGRIFVIGSTATDIVDGKTKVRFAKRQIEVAVQAAEKLGARVICFGASTKKLAEHSLRSNEFPEGIIYTNGDTLTVAIAIEEIKKNTARCSLDLNKPYIRVVIVGAYGIIGSAITEYLVRNYGCSLTLVGPNPEKLHLLAKDLDSRVELLTDVGQVYGRVHLVITATNHPNSLLSEKLLRSWGSPVFGCDVAQPRNIGRNVCKDMSRELMSWEACILENPKLIYGRSYGMGLDINGRIGKLRAVLGIKSHRTFACFAETLVLAMAQLVDPDLLKGRNFMGAVNQEDVRVILELAEKYGFYSRGAESYGKTIKAKEFKNFARRLKHDYDGESLFEQKIIAQKVPG